MQAIEEDRPLHRSVELITSGVVAIDIEVQPGISHDRVHWRAGDWSKPPLDIALGPYGIESIQVVLQDETIKMVDFPLPQAVPKGWPEFDLKPWSDDPYLDENIEVVLARLQAGELLARFPAPETQLYIEVGSGLTLGLGSDSDVVSVIIGPLLSAEWDIIETIAPAPA